MNNEPKIVVTYSAPGVGIKDVAVSTHKKTARGLYNAIKSAVSAKEQALRDKQNLCGAQAYIDIDGDVKTPSEMFVSRNRITREIELEMHVMTIKDCEYLLDHWNSICYG